MNLYNNNRGISLGILTFNKEDTLWLCIWKIENYESCEYMHIISNKEDILIQ